MQFLCRKKETTLIGLKVSFLRSSSTEIDIGHPHIYARRTGYFAYSFEDEQISKLFYHSIAMKFSLSQIENQNTRNSDFTSKIASRELFYYRWGSWKSKQKIFQKNGKNPVLITKNCIFCGKNKYANLQCVKFHVIDSISKSAAACKKFFMITLAAQVLIAVELHYHSFCCKSYFKGKKT